MVGRAALLCCLTLLSPLPAQGRSPQQLVEEAERAYSEGDFEQAYEAFLQAYGKDPNPVLLLNLAAAAWKSGRLKESLDRFDQLKEEDPDLYGQRQIEEKVLPQVRQDMARVVKGLLERGHDLMLRGRQEEALAQTRKALELEPANHEARLQEATILAKLGRWEEAAASYRATLKLLPADHPTRGLINAGRGALVRKLLTEAARLREAGQLAEAERRLEAAGRVWPGQPVLWLEEGRLAEAAGRKAKAISAYQTFLRVASPGNRSREEAEVAIRRLSGPPKGQVRLVLRPPQVQLQIDGKRQGDPDRRVSLDLGAGVQALDLPEGRHSILLSAPGYSPQERAIAIVGGESPTLEVSLSREVPGWIKGTFSALVSIAITSGLAAIATGVLAEDSRDSLGEPFLTLKDATSLSDEVQAYATATNALVTVAVSSAVSSLVMAIVWGTWE